MSSRTWSDCSAASSSTRPVSGTRPRLCPNDDRPTGHARRSSRSFSGVSSTARLSCMSSIAAGVHADDHLAVEDRRTAVPTLGHHRVVDALEVDAGDVLAVQPLSLLFERDAVDLAVAADDDPDVLGQGHVREVEVPGRRGQAGHPEDREVEVVVRRLPSTAGAPRRPSSTVKVLVGRIDIRRAVRRLDLDAGSRRSSAIASREVVAAGEQHLVGDVEAGAVAGVAVGRGQPQLADRGVRERATAPSSGTPIDQAAQPREPGRPDARPRRPGRSTGSSGRPRGVDLGRAAVRRP